MLELPLNKKKALVDSGLLSKYPLHINSLFSNFRIKDCYPQYLIREKALIYMMVIRNSGWGYRVARSEGCGMKLNASDLYSWFLLTLMRIKRAICKQAV